MGFWFLGIVLLLAAAILCNCSEIMVHSDAPLLLLPLGVVGDDVAVLAWACFG